MASNVVSKKGSAGSGGADTHVTIKLHKSKAQDLLLALTAALGGGGSKGKLEASKSNVSPKPSPKGSTVKPK